jgi:hypothetical protein
MQVSCVGLILMMTHRCPVIHVTITSDAVKMHYQLTSNSQNEIVAYITDQYLPYYDGDFVANNHFVGNMFQLIDV